MGALQTSIIIIGAVKSLWNNNGTGGRENRNKKAINPIHLELSYNNHLPFQKKEKKTPKEQHSYISLPVHRARSLSPLVVMRYITKHRRQPQDTKKNGSLSSLVSVRREKKKRKKTKKKPPNFQARGWLYPEKTSPRNKCLCGEDEAFVKVETYSVLRVLLLLQDTPQIYSSVFKQGIFHSSVVPVAAGECYLPLQSRFRCFL